MPRNQVVVADNNNNASISGNFTAASLIRSGGTAAQILAANGSVITAGTNITISGGSISATSGTSLNGTGFVRMSGTTVSYITGTSSQFVKADGSLDSSTYVTGGPYLPLSGGTMTGAIIMSGTQQIRVAGFAGIEYYNGTAQWQGYIGTENNTGNLRYNSFNGAHTWYANSTQTMSLNSSGVLTVAGYLRTAGVGGNTVLFNGGGSSVDFGNVLGQGTSSRSTMFRGSTSSVSVWWGATDGNGSNIPFAAIDATAGEFTFWRNTGGTGGGTWTNIMTMNASGLTMVSGNFIGNVTGNVSGTASGETLATVTGRGASTGTAIVMSGGSGTTPTLSLDRNIASPSNYYNGVQLEIKATSGTAGIGLHRNGFSHVGIYHDTSNVLKFDMNAGTVTLNHNTGTIWGSGNLTNLNQLTNGPGYLTSLGFSYSTGVNANHVVQRDANGYIYANHINFNTSESENPAISSFITSNGDGWSRKSSLAHVKNQIRGVADGTWGISITGASASATDALRIRFNDGPRNLSDRLPNTLARSVNWDFVGSGTVGGTGNYGGVMSFTPWDGTTGSTGDSSYQLAFMNETGINGSGIPGLRIRKGIDTTWGSWHTLLHASNVSSYALPIGGGTLTGRTYLHQAGAGGSQNLFTGVDAASSANGRGQFIMASAYSDLVIASSQANGNHGSTLSFTTYNPSNAGDYRKFVINQGNWGARAGFLDFGFADAARTNPHEYINATDDVISLDGYSKRLGINQMNPSFTVDANGTIRATSDMRAPIFYDSDNTGYYLDPAGYSNLRAIGLENRVLFGTSVGGPGANFGGGRVYLRVHPTSSGSIIMSFKLTISSTWNWAAAFGCISADVSFYFDGSNLFAPSTTITSATGFAQGNLNMGTPVIENGFVSIPIFSTNTNPIYASIDGFPSFNFNNVSWGSWQSVSYPGSAVVNVPGSMTIAGSLSVGGSSVVTNNGGTWGINVTGTSGSISGFNNPTTSATANTIAYRTAEGDLAVRELIMNVGVQDFTPSSMVAIYPTTNQAVKVTASGARNFLNVPTRTGGDASGTWSISITGSAGSVAWGNVSSKPQDWLNATNLISWNAPNDAVPSGFYENIGGSGNPVGTWFNYINVRHSNPSNVHGYQLGMSYYDNNLWFRSYQASGTYQSWSRALATQTDPFPSNMNQYVRTTDAVTFGGANINYSGSNVTGLSATHTGSISSGQVAQGLALGWTGYGATFGIVYKQGELSPSDMCHIYNIGGFYMKIFNGSGNNFHRFDDNGSVSINSSSQGSYIFNVTGDIYATADVIAFSDARVKDDVRTVENALEKVTKLRGVTYIKKDEDNNKRKMGVIAQEVLEVIPEVVHQDNDGFYGVAYGNIVGVLIEAIKEQQKQIDELKQELKNK